MTLESTCPGQVMSRLEQWILQNGDFRADDTLVRMRGIITGRYRFKSNMSARLLALYILKAITPSCDRARLVTIGEQ